MSKEKMSYRVSAKNRKIKRFFLQTMSILKFDWFNINTSLKIVIIWCIIATFWLFWNWIESYDNIIEGNSFYKLLGISWYILFIINIKVFFIIFGQKSKEFIKNLFNIKAKDSFIIVMFLVFWWIITINNVFIIENTQMFREWILLWKWLITTLVWYTLAMVGWCVNLYGKTNVAIYVENNISDDILWNEHNTNKHENNMKLPF